ncbi:MAG: preprotein translocase subunit SecY [Clostridium sp.]
MLSTLRNAWKVPELRKKFYWTIGLIAIFRMGTNISLPGVDSEFLKTLSSGSGLLSFMDLISGGAFSSLSIFALGIMPYINASIIMQLLTIAIPSLEQLSKEGVDGRKKIQNATRYVSIIIAMILSVGIVGTLANKGATTSLGVPEVIVLSLALVVGTTFCIWLADQITVKGFGNGTSILIFINIISRLPYTVSTLLKSENIPEVELVLFFLGALALLTVAIFFSLAERKIPVQYAGKAVGNKVMKGQSTHIPLSIVGSAVIAVIFSMSVMEFPKTISAFFPDASWSTWITLSKYSFFNKDTWMYPVVYVLLTVFFTWFYNQVTLKPDEMAENLNKSAGFVPGIRPGEPTTEYFEKVINRISLIGGGFAAMLAVVPILIERFTNFGDAGLSIGATAVLIVIGVSLDFSRQLESQMVMRHYEGFLK